MAKVAIGDALLDCVWIGAGPERAPSLVLLHEGLGSIALWKEIPARLARATGRGVLVYSRQGYGASSPLERARQPDYLHAEAEEILPALLAHFGIARAPILVGHSDGASIALIYAGGTARPRPAGLVLEAPHVFVEEVTIAGIERARIAFETTDLARRLARYHDDAEAAFRGWSEVWLSDGFRDWNIESLLPAIECPILQIQGRDDEYATPAQLEAIARQAGGPVETLLLDDCRHVPHSDQAEATLAAVAGFVARILDAPGESGLR